MIWAVTNDISTASPNPVSWSGPTSYERGWWTMEAKICLIGLNLGCDEARDRAAGVGVEVEAGPLALLESEKCRAGNHGGIVRCKAWTRCIDGHTLGLESRSHRRGKRAIAGDAAAEDDPLPGKSIGGAPGFLDQSSDQRILERAGQVRLVVFDVLRRAHGVEHGGLEAAEREGVIIVVLWQRVLSHHRAREMEALWISLARKLLYIAPAGVGKAEKLGDLVERFAGCVVPGRSQQAVFPPGLDVQEQRVTARDQQRCERRNGIAVLERRRKEVSFHVMNSEQRNSARECELRAGTDSDQQRPHESRSVGDGDRVEIIELRPRFRECALDHRHDAGEMRARCDFRNYSAEHAVDVLRQDHERFLGDLVALSLENGRGRLVARSLDSEDARHGYSVRSVRSLSTSARASGEFQSVADIAFLLMTPSLPTMNVDG